MLVARTGDPIAHLGNDVGVSPKQHVGSPHPGRPNRYSEIVAISSRRRSAVKQAIDVVVRRLSALPTSPEVEALQQQAEKYLREADAWTASHPVAQEKERLMKRVLKLHVEVAKLERQGPET